MRIIGGELGGRIMPFPKHFNSRATTDVAKESLFNILDNTLDYPETTILDLFSGTGNIAYEFASRGAAKVVAVEQVPQNAGFIRNTSKQYGLSAIQVIKADALKFINRAPGAYGVVFADPPYNAEYMQDLPNRVLQGGLLEEHGWFILEHSKFHSFGDHPNLFDHRRYGHVHFSFFHIEKV